MSQNVYIGNLSHAVTDSNLSELFAPHGLVESIQVALDRDTGRCRGFGFVTMSSAAEARAAIARLNGKDLDGRALIVHKARPQSQEGRGGPHGALGYASERTRRRKAERLLDTTQDDFQVARRIQQKLFPAAAPALPGLDIGGIACPAGATGGDYFDYVPMPEECVGVVFADVSGKGFGPALLMATTRAYVRAFALTHTDIGEILTLVNHALNGDSDDRFVTLLLARIDPRTRSFAYSSAGHPTGYVINPTGEVRLVLPSTGPPLGLGLDCSFPAAPAVTLEPGEVVLLLTDGVADALSVGGVAFGAERAVDTVRANRGKTAQEIVEALYRALGAFCQGKAQFDDITAIIIKVGPRLD